MPPATANQLMFKQAGILLRGLNARCNQVPGMYTQMRCVSGKKISNKKITRLESDIEIEDCEFKSRLINRNPRNLEQMSYEMKPLGYWLDKSPPTHWNRIEFNANGRHLEAALVHWTGKVLLTASTSEAILSKYMKSTNTAAAASLLAEVLARRCLQSGYLYAESTNQDSDEDMSLKRKMFFRKLAESGVGLKEPPPILPRAARDL